MDVLIDEMLQLVTACSEKEIDLIIGGGLGLFLRDIHLPVRSARYESPIFQRPTTDIDCLLSAEIIMSAESMNSLRDVIAELGYEPVVEFTQFTKGETNQRVKVDLLAAPSTDPSVVKTKNIRIRPHGAHNIHGHLTPEAATVHYRPREIVISEVAVHVPSSFNFLVLKLHAFRDRSFDEEVDFGRHHALDVFRIVAGMDPTDWEVARDSLSKFSADVHVVESIRVIREQFSIPTQIGCIRLREHLLFDQTQEVAMGHFIEDLAEIFEA